MIKMYSYSGCGSCRKALKWFDEKGIDVEVLPIRETPPSKTELETMLAVYGGEVKKLFNVSGMDYRSLDMKSKLPSMSTSEAIALLAGNGNLIKRPFVLSDRTGVVGFKEAAFETLFS